MILSNATVTVPVVRSIVHCLNANHEVEALDAVLNQMSDAELAPLPELLNQLNEHQPRVLFKVRETYLKARNEGNVQELETLLVKLLANSKLNENVVAVAQKLAEPLSALITDKDLSFSLNGFYSVLNSKSYVRLGSEYLGQVPLVRVLDSVTRYLNTDDSKSVSSLYQLLVTRKVDGSWQKAVSDDPETHIRNLANFFAWLFSGDHYQIISEGAHTILNSHVQCFNDTRPILNPISTVFNEAMNQTPAGAARFFSHDLKNLILVSHGYCTYPYATTALVDALEASTHVRGFEEAYTVLQPLLTDPDFAAFVGSTASRNFVRENSWLTQNHFFEDLFTLVSMDQLFPLTSDASKIATFIDQTFKQMNHDDYSNLILFLQPIFSAEQTYGRPLVKVLYKITNPAPILDLNLSDALRNKLKSLITTVLQKNETSKVLNLMASLIQSHRLDSIVDQTLVYFSNLFKRGQYNLIFKKLSFPAILEQPLTQLLIEQTREENKVVSPCSGPNLDWNFEVFVGQNQTQYQNEMDAIARCVDANPTTKAALDFMAYAVPKNEFSELLSLQSSLVSSAFITASDLTLDTLTDILSMGQSDSNTLRKVFELASATVSNTKDAFLNKVNFRKFSANLVEGKELYASLQELAGQTPKRTRTDQPTLDLKSLTHLNVIYNRKKNLKNVGVEDALKGLMDEYCPSRNSSVGKCLIDRGQLALYLQSPNALYAQIVNDYLGSSQSWGLPDESTQWIHTSDPTQVSDFEFHLNPLLHLLRNSPQVPSSALRAVRRIQHDGMHIGSFISDRAIKMTLVPYYYQVGNFPAQSKRQYSDHIRLRLVSDLDRLELIAINADFKAFGIVGNIGMGFLRQIALAWGDTPESDRPKSLSRFVRSKEVKTLKQVRTAINRELSLFDTQLIQSLGECALDKGAIGRFIFSRLCNPDVSDLSARLFNLRSMVSLLDEELPETDGGANGLIFLRDLFYSLYEGNTSNQKDAFANGVELDSDCLKDPMSFDSTVVKCQKDLLTLVPRITNLGLLHQAGVAVINHQDHPVSALSSIVERVANNEALANTAIASISADSGITLAKDAVEYGFQAPPGTGENLGLMVQVISTASNLNWAQWVLELMPKDARVLKQNQNLLNSLLSLNAEKLKPWVDYWLATPEAGTVQLLNTVSTHLDADTRSDLTQLMIDLTPTSNALADTVQSVKNLPGIELQSLTQDIEQWSKVLQQDSSTGVRADLAQWITGNSFDEFTRVFADAQFVDKAYNFLEAINQNPDSKLFLNYCKDFLNSH